MSSCFVYQVCICHRPLYTKCLVCVHVLCHRALYAKCAWFAGHAVFVARYPSGCQREGGGGEGEYLSAMALGWWERGEEAEQEQRTLMARWTSRWECASHRGSPRQDPHPGPAAVWEACVLPGDWQVRGHRRTIKSEWASWVHVNVAHPIITIIIIIIITIIIIIIIYYPLLLVLLLSLLT